MLTLGILLTVFLVTLLLNKIWHKKLMSVAWAGRIAMCAMLLFTGISHFYLAEGMILMIPDFLPAKLTLVYLTGGLEILFGFGLLFEKTRKLTSVLLILFLLVILPANIVASVKHVNIQNADFTGPGLGYLWFRIPLQILFMSWIYLFGWRAISKTVHFPSVKKSALT